MDNTKMSLEFKMETEKVNNNIIRKRCSKCSKCSMIKWSMSNKCKCNRMSRTMEWKGKKSSMGKEMNRLMVKKGKLKSNIIKNKNKSDFITSFYISILIIYFKINIIISDC